MERNQSSETTVRMEYLKDRIKDFLEATALFDSRGFALQEVYSPMMLRAVIENDATGIEDELTQAFARLRSESEEVQWLKASAEDRFKELTVPLT